MSQEIGALLDLLANILHFPKTLGPLRNSSSSTSIGPSLEVTPRVLCLRKPVFPETPPKSKTLVTASERGGTLLNTDSSEPERFFAGGS